MMNNTEKHGNGRKAMEIFTKGGRLASAGFSKCCRFFIKMASRLHRDML